MTFFIRRLLTSTAGLAALVLFLVPLASQAQFVRHTLIRPAEQKFNFNVPNLSASAQVTPLLVDMQAFRKVAAPQLRLADVPVAPGINIDIDLVEYSLLTKDAKLITTGDDGEHPMDPLSARLYRGTVVGDPTSQVFLSFANADIVGSVQLKGKTYQIATDHNVRSSADMMAAISYPIADVRGPLVLCGVNDANEAALGGIRANREIMEQMLSNSGTVDITINFMVPGAFEADWEYLQLFKDDANPAQAAADYMYQIVGSVSAIYERDINTQIMISYMNIYTSQAAQPYGESAAMDLALYQAREFWRNQRGSVKRSFAHVFSGKGWKNPIGIAFLSVLCQPENAMAYSLITRLGTTQDITVVAHENGHMFGSVHTHSCSWMPAIDSCAAAEGGGCFGSNQITASTGTIMSYCAAKEMKFHPKTAQVIRNRVANAGEPCVVPGRKLIVKPHLTSMPKVDVNMDRDTLIKDFYQNPSVSPVEVSELQITGQNAQRYSILEGAPPFTLGPGETRDLKVRFRSPVQEPSFGTFTVIHNGYNSSVSVYFEAYAEDRQPDLGIRVDAVNENINFGTLRLGEERDTTLVRMFFNAGTAPVHVDSTWIIGPDRYDFQMVEGNGPFDIEIGSTSISARFRFRPQDTGTKNASLVIRGNSRDREYDTVALTADVKRGPLLLLALNSLSVNFGEREKRVSYDTSFSQFFYNAGSDTLLLGVDVYGREENSFTSTLTGIHEMAPGDKLDMSIGLFDSTDGVKQAYLVIDHIRLDTNGTGLDETYRRDTVWLIAFVGNYASAPFAINAGEAMSLAPNPANSTTVATISPLAGEAGRPFTLRLIDNIGRHVLARDERFGADAMEIRIETSALPPGVYYMLIESDVARRVSTLTVTR